MTESGRNPSRRLVRALWLGVGMLAVMSAFVPAPAAAEPKKLTFRTGAITLNPYEVRQQDTSFDVPKPDVDGFITDMDARLVDKHGKEMPRQRLMLHHIVFLNLGRRLGERHDASCDRYKLFDAETELPGAAERFFGLGEERAQMHMPPGYGYPVKGDDRWLVTWMLMNHRRIRDTAYIEYEITYDTAPEVKPAYPVWFDVVDCSADPVFDVPGGGRRNSTFTKQTDWTVPYNGRIIGARGHVHGGAKRLAVSQPDCADRELFASDPVWGRPNHPIYKLRPVLHEKGPLWMSGIRSAAGWPVAAGQRLRLTSTYDAELPHTRSMGIMLMYITPDEGVREGCAPAPLDVEAMDSTRPDGVTAAPRMKVPLTAYGPDGKVQTINRPPGRTAERRSGSTIDVRDFRFEPRNVAVRPGASLRWLFRGSTLHNVTLANGPRGFSSANLSDERSFTYRFKRRGTYELFCAIHPVGMNATVTVDEPDAKR